MSETINRKELLSALTDILPGVGSQERDGQLACFFFDEDKVWTYNDSIVIAQDIKTDISGAVNADKFHKLISKITDDEIKISVKAGTVFIKTENIKAQIKIEGDIKDYFYPTELIEANNQDNWSPVGDNFKNQISVCLSSVGKNVNNQAFGCLYFENDQVVSTDGYRATIAQLHKSVNDNFLLHNVSAQKLIKYNTVDMFVSEDWLYFKDVDGLVFAVKQISIEYPIKEVLNIFNATGEEVTLPNSYQNVIDRTGIITFSEIALDNFVALTIEDNKITCGGDSIFGNISEASNIDYSGEKISIIVNPDYFINALKTSNKMMVCTSVLIFQGDDARHALCLSE